MSLPKAKNCADCNAPIDYAGGRWQNVAPEGQKERIVCRPCWRKNYRKPPDPAPAVAAQPSNPSAVEVQKPASQALADAVIALVGASELRSRQLVKSELAKRWRGV